MINTHPITQRVIGERSFSSKNRTSPVANRFSRFAIIFGRAAMEEHKPSGSVAQVRIITADQLVSEPFRQCQP